MFVSVFTVINGEKAAFNTPTFAKKRERTLDMLIKDLYSEHMNDTNRVVSLNKFEIWEKIYSLYSDVCFDIPSYEKNNNSCDIEIR